MSLNPFDAENEGLRVLSDRGIKQALDEGLIKVTPSLDYLADTTRIQPATIDLKMGGISETEIIDGNIFFNDSPFILPARSKNEVLLTEKY